MADNTPVSESESLTTMVRAYPADLPALDRVVEALRREQPKATRADAIRRLLEYAAATGMGDT